MHMLGDSAKAGADAPRRGREYTAVDLAAEEQREVLLHFSAPSVGANRQRPAAAATAVARSPALATCAFDCLNVAAPLEPVLPPGLL